MKQNIVVISLLFVVPATAEAGAVLRATALDAEVRAELTREVARARREDPRPFRALEALRGSLEERDRADRAGEAPITLALKDLGRSVVLPMLEEIALADRPGLKAELSFRWRLALIEAVGGDQRAVPVLRAVIDRAEEPALVRAAAEGLASIGSDLLVEELIARAGGSSARERAVRAALGRARRTIAVRTLARAASAETDPAELAVLVGSLTDIGNAWAWKTPALAASGEEEDVRAEASAALFEIFLRTRGRLRADADMGMAIVGHPTALAALNAAYAEAEGEESAAIEEARDRFRRLNSP